MLVRIVYREDLDQTALSFRASTIYRLNLEPYTCLFQKSDLKERTAVR